MSAFYSFLSFLPPLLIGFLLASVLWSKEERISSDLPLKCALSVGFGFGTSSCLVFLWMMAVGSLTRGILVCELLLVAGLSLILFRRQRAGVSALADSPNSVAAPSRQRPYVLRSVFCLASLSAIIRFCGLTQQYPHGQYDAFSIWNLRARFLYEGAQYWKEFTHATADSQIDYPLLVPASVARSWELIGEETQLIPSVIALLFTFATISLVTASISHLRGERQGLLAGLVLVGTPFLIFHGASQYADVPLAFFFVATVVLLFLHAESPSEMNFLILAGMAAASSAWTKNEGIAFLILLFFLHPLVTFLTKGKKQCATEILALLIGAVPISAVIFIYKFCLASQNSVVAREGIGSTVPKLLDLSRYHLVIHWFLSSPFYFGGWNPLTAMPVLLIFYFLLLGASVRKEEVSATSIAVLLPLFMSVSYFFVYILSPFNLAWHLGSSLDRLLLQVWPLVIFTYFMVVQTPEQALITHGSHAVA
jgi:4-amino-4-deoxy-L-arabinose transferase-like glycosyltransferase